MFGQPHLGWWILMVILIIFAISSLAGQFYGVTVPGPGDPSTWKKQYPKYGGGIILALVWGGLAALAGYHIHKVSKPASSPKTAAPAAAAPTAAPAAAPTAAPP
jgi:hypothetical protein